VGPRAGLDDVEKRIFLILPGFEIRPLGRPVRRHRYTDYAVLFGGIVPKFLLGYIPAYSLGTLEITFASIQGNISHTCAL
jgi:hypothetical protein